MVSKGTAEQESGITNWQGQPDAGQPHGSTGTTHTDAIAGSSDMTLAERLESLKVGLLGAFVTGLVYILEKVANQWLGLQVPRLATLPGGETGLNLFVCLGSAILAGFLFGVTYRYAIRRDRNSHLGDGAVLAFGLVRGLALVEGRLPFHSEVLPAVVLVVESILLFAVARFILDGAFHHGWIKPFPANELG